MFNSGSWADLPELKDPELVELAEILPQCVLQGRAPATVKKYAGAYSRWKRWADTKPEIVKELPPKPLHIALYLLYLAQKANSIAPLNEAVNALSWVNQVAMVEDSTSHAIVVQTLAGCKRLLAHSTSKKEPITPEILNKLVEKFCTPEASLSDIRTIAICLVGFAGFFRFDELSKIKESDVQFFPEHMEIFVQSSKTDQFREGARVLIARTGSPCCPVAMLERYMSLANIKDKQDEPLFRGLISTKAGQKLRKSGSLSYTRVRELILEKLAAIGLDTKQFGIHSLRAGGASAAANAGVPDRMFKRHGRWCSENAKDGYVKDSVAERLQVSSSLGL